MQIASQTLSQDLDAIKDGAFGIERLKSLIDIAANRALLQDELAEAKFSINAIEKSFFHLA